MIPYQRKDDEVTVIVIENPEDLERALSAMLGNEQAIMDKVIERVGEMTKAVKKRALRDDSMTPLKLFKKLMSSNRGAGFENDEYELLFAAALYMLAFDYMEIDA